MRPIRNRTPEERAIILRGALADLSLDEVNAQLPPEVACPPSSYKQIKYLEAEAIRQALATVEELADQPRTRSELSQLLR